MNTAAAPQARAGVSASAQPASPHRPKGHFLIAPPHRLALGFGLFLLANLLASPPAAAQGSAAAATMAPNRCSEALLRVWGFEVYTARLCAGADFRADAFARAPFTLELRYLRAFKAADIARRSIEEMRRGGPLDAAQAQAWREQLERALPDVQPGDRLTGIHEPGRGVRFLYNGQPWRSPVGDAVFAERFFGIWLAPHTSEPALREALLAPLGAS